MSVRVLWVWVVARRMLITVGREVVEQEMMKGIDRQKAKKMKRSRSALKDADECAGAQTFSVAISQHRNAVIAEKKE